MFFFLYKKPKKEVTWIKKNTFQFTSEPNYRELIATKIHSTHRNKAGIMFDYPRRVPFFSISTTSVFLVIPALPVCCTSRPPEMAGWPQQWALLGRYDLCTLAACFPARFCQVHLDSAPPLSRVIISSWKSPLMLATPLATRKRATCPEICVAERFWASAGLCVCVCLFLIWGLRWLNKAISTVWPAVRHFISIYRSN